ncbi:hypothetical protein [Spirosoma pollinicola]|uniref:DUF3575 domain-containing protein n=1 Tax=Spirosoma pollinicola TaxID=2057025 RepID=A0A2K8Z1T9_9BACT|nr:hypothetical protein [Spirosoma pollinicola]AUD03853.1 hypothetical protein CWM47_19695 [Spirosoma pollinicola]
MKPFSLLFLLGLFLALSQSARSQQTSSFSISDSKVERNSSWVVKFAPLSLLDPSNTIQFGLERFMGSHQSLQIEAGYGRQSMNLWQTSQESRYSNTENWRGRAEWRYYWKGGPLGSYLAIEGLYKQVTAYENGTVGIGCETGQCQYYQRFSSPIAKRVWAGHLKFGRQFPLSPNNRLVADFYGGLGVRWNSVDRTIQPDSYYYYQARGYTLFDPFSYTPYPRISISYGIKFGYAF